MTPTIDVLPHHGAQSNTAHHSGTRYSKLGDFEVDFLFFFVVSLKRGLTLYLGLSLVLRSCCLGLPRKTWKCRCVPPCPAQVLLTVIQNYHRVRAGAETNMDGQFELKQKYMEEDVGIYYN